MKPQQHGDVLLIPVKSIPKNAKLVISKDRVILAEGEVTGHAHAIADTKNAELYELDLRKFVNIRGPVALTHEEHHTQTIEPGTYEVGIVKEYDYFQEMTRNVVD